MALGTVDPAGIEPRRALVFLDRPLVVDLIELTLNHGLFAVRAASTLAEAEVILAHWRPHMGVVDMDREDGPELLARLGASNTMRQSRTPVLGLTRRGDLKTKLKAFDSRGRRYPDGAVLAGGAAGAGHRHQPARVGDRPPIIAADQAR